MKRFFFSLIALSAAAIGCTQSAMLETPELGGIEVSFSPYTGRTPETKASSIIGATGEPDGGVSLAEAGGFKVFGFLDDGTVHAGLNNINVYLDDNGQWTYDNIVYWPTDSDLSFVAYSANGVGNFVDENGSSEDSEGNPIQASSTGFTFKVPTDIDEQVDLLVTKYLPNQKSSLDSDGNVALTFHHLLSRVGFQVVTTTDLKVTIKELSFNGKMYSQGFINFKSAQGNNVPMLQTIGNKTAQNYTYITGGATSVSTFVTDPATSQKVSRPTRIPRSGSEYLMIMPHTIGQNDDHIIQVTYRVENSNVDKVASVYLDPFFEFKAGKAYEFILKISTSKILFTITETGWTDQDESSTTYPLNPIPQDAVSLGVANSITSTSAIIPVTVNYEDEDIYELGVVYREYDASNSQPWNPISSDDVVSQPTLGTHTFTLAGLDPTTTYEYCAYVKADAESTPIYYPGSSYPTFTTSVDVTVEVNDNTENGARLTGRCESGDIQERGFYWVDYTTDGVPSASDNKITLTSSSTNFETILTGLKSGTDHTCWAYVKIGDVTYFSSAQKFRTKFMVSDDTGADEGDGGEIEI